jgi:hypothetical protein
MTSPNTTTLNVSVAYRFRTMLTEAMVASGAVLDHLESSRPLTACDEAIYHNTDRSYDAWYNLRCDIDELITTFAPVTDEELDYQMKVAADRAADDDEESVALVERVRKRVTG